MNSASRLLAIYDSLVSDNNEQPMVRVWTRVFGLEHDKRTIKDELTTCLVGLRNEIEFVRIQLLQREVPLQLTNPGFDRLKEVAAPARLHTAWSSMRGNVQAPECRQAFVWAEWVLRDDAESDLPDEEMHTLEAELEGLEAGLQEVEMSPYLRDFVQRQVDTIRAALRLYRVQGARLLQEALTKIAGSYTVENSAWMRSTQPQRLKLKVSWPRLLVSSKRLPKSVITWIRLKNLAKEHLAWQRR